MSDTTTFGAMLIRLRLHSGYTQKEIAASTGISRSSYCHLEADYRKPTMEFFIKLCIFYKQNPVKLLLPLFPEESMDSQKHYLQYLNSLCEIRYKSDTKRNRKRSYLLVSYLSSRLLAYHVKSRCLNYKHRL